MTTVTIDEMQRDLISYMHRAAADETILVLEENKPLAEINPVSSREKPQRPFGLYKGKINLPDDFNDPLPEELQRQFERRDE